MSEIILDHNKLSPEMEEIRWQLDEYVIGQEEAKNQLIDALSRTLTPVPRKKPIASLFFVGPTGVGKTEVAKAIGKILFGNEDYDLKASKIDGNTFLEGHTISELIGSPAGYVGSEENSPRLSDEVLFRDFRKAKEQNTLHPLIKSLDNFAILLVDEVEKAHPNLHDLLMNVLEDGNLTLRGGKEDNPKIKHSKYTDFKNVLIIMTSNLGAKEVQEIQAGKTRTMGFQTEEKKEVIPRSFYEEKMKDFFKPEFLGRITEFIPFTSLTKEDFLKRAEMEITRFNKKLNGIIIFDLSDKVKTHLVSLSIKTESGARALVNEFQKNIETIIARISNNGEISRIESEQNKSLSYIEIDLGKDNNYLVKAKFDKNNNLDERFSRKIIKGTTKLASDEIIVSLKNGSLLYTLKEEILPRLFYLKVLYDEKDNISLNFEEEIDRLEKELSSWGLTKKDFDLSLNEVYRNRFKELTDTFQSLDGVQIWEKNKSIDDTIWKKVIKKVCENFLKKNLFMINGGSGGLDEITSLLVELLERNLGKKLTKEETNLVIIIIHREYLNHHKTIPEEIKKEEKKESKTTIQKTNEITIKQVEQAKSPLTINLTINFYGDSELPKEEKIRKFKEIGLNLFGDKLEEIMLLVKQSIKNPINEKDLIFILEDVKEKLENLTTNQENYINELIQEYLKNNID